MIIFSDVKVISVQKENTFDGSIVKRIRKIGIHYTR